MDEHRVDAVAPHDAAPAGANVHDGVVLRPHGVGKRVGPAVDEHADAAGIHRRSAPREVFTEQAMPAASACSSTAGPTRFPTPCGRSSTPSCTFPPAGEASCGATASYSVHTALG